MLEQSDLFLQLFGELVESILGQNVLLFSLADGFALIVEKAGTFFFSDYFGGIVEEDTSRVIGEKIAQPVLRAVVDPLGDPDSICTGLGKLVLLRNLLRCHIILLGGCGSIMIIILRCHVGSRSLQFDYVGRCTDLTCGACGVSRLRVDVGQHLRRYGLRVLWFRQIACSHNFIVVAGWGGLRSVILATGDPPRLLLLLLLRCVVLMVMLMVLVLLLGGRGAPVEARGQELPHVLGGGRAGQKALRQVLGDGPAVVKELVRHDLVKVGPALRITVEDACDEVACRIAYIDVVGKGVAVLFDSSVRGFHVGRLEGRFANNQCVDNDPERPDIDFVRVAGFAFEDFGGDVVGRAANRSLLLTVKVKLGRQTEIAQFDLHLVVKK